MLPHGFSLPPALPFVAVGVMKVLLGGDTKYLRQLRYELGLLSVKQMKALAVGCPEYVQLVEQCHGDIMKVPMGWAHAVISLRPCLMVAFDYITLEKLPLVAIMQCLLGSAVFGQRSAEDYAGVFARISSENDNMLRYA